MLRGARHRPRQRGRARPPARLAPAADVEIVAATDIASASARRVPSACRTPAGTTPPTRSSPTRRSTSSTSARRRRATRAHPGGPRARPARALREAAGAARSTTALGRRTGWPGGRTGAPHRAQLASRAHRAPTPSSCVAEAPSAGVTQVVWHTLRTRPRRRATGSGDNWRLDPAVAGGGVLTDHGWHVCYILHRWIGTRRRRCRPASRRGVTRARGGGHRDASPHLPDATAEVLLTWASDERRNWAQLERHGRRHRAPGRHPGPPAPARRAALVVPAGCRTARSIPTGSTRSPDAFLAEVTGGAPTRQSGRGLDLRRGRERWRASRAVGAGRRSAVAVATAVDPPRRARGRPEDRRGPAARAAGLLLILPAGPAVSPHTPVAGLPLLRRIALAGSRAGLLPSSPGPHDASPCSEGIAVEPAPTVKPDRRAAGASSSARQRHPPGALAARPRGITVEPETLYVDPSMVALIDTEDPGKVLAEAARASTADDLIAALGDRLGRRPASFDPRGRFPLAGPATRPRPRRGSCGA